MGIPFFFYWLRKNFSTCIHTLRKEDTFKDIHLDEKKTHPVIDNLAIDLNGVFHHCAQKIFEYGIFKKPERFLRKKPLVQTLKKQIELFEEICKTINFLVLMVQPQKRLILSVDGVAGVSKIAQQRQRRYRSAKEQKEDSFNNHVLTTGTKFMDYLTKYIDWFIRKKISDGSWRHLEIVFSNEKAVGEGEYKILSFIRYFGNKDESYCLHGADADLIMLSLGSHVKDFYIIRENMYDEKEYLVINIGLFRSDLVQYMDWTTEEKEIKKYCQITSINDFVFICFMIGNDFLPHIPTLEILDGGIEVLLDVYKNVGETYGHLTRKYNDQIVFNKKSLEVFLGTISQYEKGTIEDKLNKKEPIFPDELLNQFCQSKEEGIQVDLKNYKQAYYKEKFKDTTIKEICHKYLEGMQWVLTYYTKGMPNWRWFYSYHYAPFAEEMAKHIKTFHFPVYGRTTPLTPFQQLLAVLPPSSADLIPEPLCDLLKSESPIADFYPKEFKIDLGGKRKEWEGRVLLPMIDIERLEKAYQSKINNVDKTEAKRNILGKSFVYRFTTEDKGVFKSFYGDIPKLKVITETIDI